MDIATKRKSLKKFLKSIIHMLSKERKCSHKENSINTTKGAKVWKTNRNREKRQAINNNNNKSAINPSISRIALVFAPKCPAGLGAPMADQLCELSPGTGSDTPKPTSIVELPSFGVQVERCREIKP